jgi:antitoxin component of MazEF toxin-antitoxin module
VPTKASAIHIVDFPPEQLEEMGLAAGDELDVEVADGLTILSPRKSPYS